VESIVQQRDMYRVLATQSASSPVCTVYCNMFTGLDVGNFLCTFVNCGVLAIFCPLSVVVKPIKSL
jgi:hypothetical protein